MRKNKPTDFRLLDEHLDAMNNMQAAEPKPFFYTRLQAKMNKQSDWQFPVKPSWIVGALALLLAINSFITINEKPSAKTPDTASPLQSFASAYDLNIQSVY